MHLKNIKKHKVLILFLVPVLLLIIDNSAQNISIIQHIIASELLTAFQPPTAINYCIILNVYKDFVKYNVSKNARNMKYRKITIIITSWKLQKLEAKFSRGIERVKQITEQQTTEQVHSLCIYDHLYKYGKTAKRAMDASFSVFSY